MRIFHKSRTTTCTLVLVLLPFIICNARSSEYDDLGDIYNNIISNANNSGGDATWFRLKDASGSNILTEGSTYPTNIYCLKISKGSIETGRKNILVLGTQHAREWIGYRCVLDCAAFIINNRNNAAWPSEARFTNHFARFKDMNISNLTENANIYFIPVVNPSGYIYSRVNDGTNNLYSGWRKNRRDTNGDPAPTSGYLSGEAGYPGVDLDRNWPGSDWGQTGLRAFPPPNGSNTQIQTSWYTNDNVYCGRPTGNNWTNWPCAPICEKEVQGVVTLTDSNDFKLIIDVHSFGREVGWAENMDAASVHLRPNQGWSNDIQIMKLLASKAASLIKDPDTGSSYTPTNGPYPVSGDVLWYMYEKSGSNAVPFLIEVGPNFRPLNATAHSDAVMPGLLFMMFSAVDQNFSAKPSFKFRKQ